MKGRQKGSREGAKRTGSCGGGRQLSLRLARFVHEYLVDLNGTQAAIRAGYAPARAKVTACELLKNPVISAKVDALIRERNERLKVDADNVVRELLRIAFMDIGEVFDSGGRLKSLEGIPPEFRRAIAGIEVFEEYAGKGEGRVLIGYTKKVRLVDKIRALETLTKHVVVRDLFPQRVEVSGPSGGEIPMGNTELANRILFLLTQLEKQAIKEKERQENRTSAPVDISGIRERLCPAIGEMKPT